MPTLTFERQKMSVEIWEKLKSHIMKQREKRKQEQEQDAEQERHRREQEQKRKRDAITLEDIKDQLSKLESNLSELQQKKSDLFLQLKKVLNEDEMRKKQTETNILAARQAIMHAVKAQSNNQQMNQIMLNQSANSRMLPTASNPAAQLQPQQLTAIQQQQLLSKHSPVTTTVTSLSNHPNYMNTVINSQSLAPVHQQQSQQQAQQLSNKQQSQQSLPVSRKRPLDRSSPQMTVPSNMPQQYNGILPNYKTPMTSYAPAVSRIATTSQQAFFPQSRPLSIPVSSQQSLSSGQLNFDAKSHPYLTLAGALPSDSSLTPEQHANLINSAAAQFNQQQLSQLQQELYYQHLIKSSNMPANLQSSSLMSMQNAPMKAGITSGYPIVQRPGSSSNPPSTSANNPNSNNAARFPGRYMY